MSEHATTTDPATSLRLERTFAATPDAVFDAWTSPEVLRRWWAAGPDWSTPEAEVDLRVGGRYRLTMENPADGARHSVGGEYTEVERPHRLAYTWTWETEGEQSPSAGSLVEVDFRAEGDGTTVVLLHSGLGTKESRDGHEHGWNACLDNLGARVLEAGA